MFFSVNCDYHLLTFNALIVCDMSGQKSVFLFGHSFPARLLRQARDQHTEPKKLIGLSNRFTIFV